MLDSLFSPKSVAVIGAAREEGKVGHDILDNLILSDYAGGLYPVNPKAEEIHGIRCYPSIADVPADVDLAIIVIPAKLVPGSIEECGKKGVKIAVVISAGFKEVGGEGVRLEKSLIEAARKYGLRVVGPNCLGVINTGSRLNASFAKDMPLAGNIALVSQSGALCTAILDWAKAEEVGFSKFISLGNKADVSENEVLEIMRDDDETSVIALYLEAVKDGSSFVESAKSVSAKKPLLVLKAGRTEAGARAVSSHTGSLAGSDRAYSAALRQAHALQVDSMEELFDLPVAFAYQPLPKNNRVAIITNAGGPGIIASDACEKLAIRLASLGDETLVKLRENLPGASNIYNPVDVLGDATASRYELALRAVLEDEAVGGVMVLLTPQAMTEIEETARTIVETVKGSDKTVMACFMGEADIASGIKILREGRIPNSNFPEKAAKVFSEMVKYATEKKVSIEPAPTFDVNSTDVSTLFEECSRIGRMNVGDLDALRVVGDYGLRIPETVLVKSPQEAVEVAHKIGFPVVLKIVSPQIIHKTDIGGVKLGLEDEDSVTRGFDQIMTNVRRYAPHASIWGISVQEQFPQGRETIIGISRDPQFGPLIMFGLGGIFVEALKDVSFRIMPITPFDAKQMVLEIQSYPLLRGVRGQPSADFAAIENSILRVAQLVKDFPEIVELDINPLIVYEAGKGAIAADARLTLEV